MRSGIEAGRLCYRYLGADAVQHAEDDEPREQKGTTHLREHEGDPCNSYPLVPASSSNSAGCKFKRNATRSWPDMTDRQSLNLLQDVDDRLRHAGLTEIGPRTQAHARSWPHTHAARTRCINPHSAAPIET